MNETAHATSSAADDAQDVHGYLLSGVLTMVTSGGLYADAGTADGQARGFLDDTLQRALQQRTPAPAGGDRFAPAGFPGGRRG
jgi:hypothetical protein